MRGLLAVARREIAERRMLFVAAAIAAVAPFAVPWLHGLHGINAADVRGGTALALSLTLLLGAMAFIGGTRLPRALADRRIGFDFARPLSGFAIWGGTLAAALVLAIGSAFVAFAPAALAGETSYWRNLVDSGELPIPWPIAVIGASIFIFGLFGAAGIALRARSPLLLADLLLFAGAVLAAAFVLIRLQWAGASHVVVIRALLILVAFAVVALLAAGLAAVSRGRVDIRAANRAQSVTLWGITAIGLLTVFGYGEWLLSAPPRELASVQLVEPSVAGTWVYVEGTARGADASFLYDTASRSYARIPSGSGEAVFSADGSRAAWIQKRGDARAVRIVQLGPGEPSPVKHFALTSKAGETLVLDESGSRLAIVEDETVSVHDIASGRLLASARIGPIPWSPRLMFDGPNRLRLYSFAQHPHDTAVEIRELDVSTRRLSQLGEITGLVGWPMLATDRGGRTLACLELEPKRLRLFDARSGQFLATLYEHQTGATRFLSDGRIVVLAARGSGHVLSTYSAAGALLVESEVPGGPHANLGGEALPGHVVVASGAWGDMASYLVAIDGDAPRKLGDHLEPVSRWLRFFGTVNAVASPGEGGATLFRTGNERSLVRVDPTSGKQEIVLGSPKRSAAH